MPLTYTHGLTPCRFADAATLLRAQRIPELEHGAIAAGMDLLCLMGNHRLAPSAVARAGATIGFQIGA